MTLKLDDANFGKEVLESNMPVLVDFWAPWCGPCSMVAPVVDDLAKVYAGRMKVGKLNVDKCGGLASQYGVMSIPTLIIFKSGKVVEQIVGVMTKKALEEKIDQHI